MIEMGKQYQTRNGKAVRILCVDGPGSQPVVGIVEGEDSLDTWNMDGTWGTRSDSWDLVPVPVKHEATMQWGQCFEPAVYVSDAQSIVLLTDFLKGLPKNVHEIRLIWEE
mgnify:CR=1 FL=1